MRGKFDILATDITNPGSPIETRRYANGNIWEYRIVEGSGNPYGVPVRKIVGRELDSYINL